MYGNDKVRIWGAASSTPRHVPKRFRVRLDGCAVVTVPQSTLGDCSVTAVLLLGANGGVRQSPEPIRSRQPQPPSRAIQCRLANADCGTIGHQVAVVEWQQHEPCPAQRKKPSASCRGPCVRMVPEMVPQTHSRCHLQNERHFRVSLNSGDS